MAPMAITGMRRYRFWEWCVKQSRLPETPVQQKCAHNFGPKPADATSLGFLIWRCSNCKRVIITDLDGKYEKEHVQKS